jgi:hypothetical protein
MTCPACERSNPADAQFCVYCSARLAAAAPTAATTVAPQPAPATGPTMRLPMTAAPSYTTPAPVPASVPPMSTPAVRRSMAYLNQSSAALFLIGLGVLFLTGNIWPGILVLLGLIGFINEAGRGRQQRGLSGLIFMVGLAFLFWSGLLFPGILILLGIMVLLNRQAFRH